MANRDDPTGFFDTPFGLGAKQVEGFAKNVSGKLQSAYKQTQKNLGLYKTPKTQSTKELQDFAKSQGARYNPDGTFTKEKK